MFAPIRVWGASASLLMAICAFEACSSPHGGVVGDGGSKGGASGSGGSKDGGTADQPRDSSAAPDASASGGAGTPDAAVDSTGGGTGGTGGQDAALDVPSTNDAALDVPSTPQGCLDGATRSCKDDPDLMALGNCGGGVELCTAGKWGACSVAPASKDSCALIGDDATCNGKPNEGCPCVDGDKQPCGPAADVGICKRGTQTCAGTVWGACTGAVYAAARDCTSAADNNCDGLPDNTLDAVCVCAATTTQPCGAHAGKDGNGRCKAGTQTCVAATDHKTSAWGTCMGSVGPATADACTTGNDDNCNGIANEGCTCVEGSKQPCGPAAEIGVCKKGSQTCTGGAWGACVGAVSAAARDCTSMLDNDCDGHPDNTIDAVCKCASGASQACGQHAGQDGKGPCKAGSQTCVVAADRKSSVWGACSGSVGPASRDCTSTTDNDCSGLPDNQDTTCLCPAGTTGACPGNNTGSCRSGTRMCILSADKASTTWATTCVGQVLPAAADTCSPGNDATCNMKLNEGCECLIGDPPKTCPCGTQTCNNGKLNPCVSACPAAPPNGTPVCTAGACDFMCDAGRFKCGTRCYPDNVSLFCPGSGTPLCASWDFESGRGSWGPWQNSDPLVSVSIAASPAGKAGSSLAYTFSGALNGDVGVTTPICSSSIVLPARTSVKANVFVSMLNNTTVAVEISSDSGESQDDVQVMTNRWTPVVMTGFDPRGSMNLGITVLVGQGASGTIYLDDFEIVAP